MAKQTIKKNDNVTVLTGRDKGKTAKVLKVFPKESRVLVEGVNTVKKHQRPRKSGQKGQVVEVSLPMHISNVKLSGEAKKAPKKVASKVAKKEETK